MVDHLITHKALQDEAPGKQWNDPNIYFFLACIAALGDWGEALSLVLDYLYVITHNQNINIQDHPSVRGQGPASK